MTSETTRSSSSDEADAAQSKAPLPGGDAYPDPVILPKIRGPEDVRRLPKEKLPDLAEEIRHVLTRVVALNGGHLSSNLGVTELTIALHRVFDFSEDRLTWDVSHQVYVHKLLTGRYDGFDNLRQKDGISGFSNPDESHYDTFMAAHASTSISTSLGLSAADHMADRRRHIVAVIGDGAMTGGVAFEALNQAGHLKRNLLVILNDNQMAISPTVGALNEYLSRVRAGSLYNDIRDELRSLVGKIPLVGDSVDRIIGRLLSTVQDIVEPGHIFRELGFRYFGPVGGHDIEGLLGTLNDVKQIDGPVLLHVLTDKGRGLPYAVDDPEKFHSPSGFSAPSELNEPATTKSSGESYSKVFTNALIEEAEADKRICAVTAAMPSGTGLTTFAEKFPDRFYDVGICEQHAVAFSAGLARAGAKPVAAIYSTFLQRAYDMVFHELCLQEGRTPVVIGIDRGGLVGGDGATTHGVFDIAYLRTLPNLIHMSPKDGPELKAMLHWALASDKVVAIRYARGSAPDLAQPGPEIELSRGEIFSEGEDVAILGYGPHMIHCIEAASILGESGITPTLASGRFAKPVDDNLIGSLLEKHRVVVTVEDHARMGGFGAAVLESAADQGADVSRLVRVGIPDRFIQHGGPMDCYRDAGIDPESIAKSAREALERTQ